MIAKGNEPQNSGTDPADTSQGTIPDAPAAGSKFARFEDALFAVTPIAPLVFFRVLFGGIMLWEVSRYFSHDWIERY